MVILYGFIFHSLDEDKTTNTCRITMETEIWTWGLNSKGQLGLGDMIERFVQYFISVHILSCNNI